LFGDTEWELPASSDPCPMTTLWSLSISRECHSISWRHRTLLHNQRDLKDEKPSTSSTSPVSYITTSTNQHCPITALPLSQHCTNHSPASTNHSTAPSQHCLYQSALPLSQHCTNHSPASTNHSTAPSQHCLCQSQHCPITALPLPITALPHHSTASTNHSTAPSQHCINHSTVSITAWPISPHWSLDTLSQPLAIICVVILFH